MHKDGNPAFTLIEILIVILIIAALMLLLMPAISKMQAKGLQARCMGNQKQIYAAWALYPADHDGIVLPCYYVYGPNSSANWDGILSDGGYLPNPNMINIHYMPSAYQCPANPWHAYYWRNSNYAYNYLLGYPDSSVPSGNVNIRLGNIPAPTKFVILADAGIETPDFGVNSYGPPVLTWLFLKGIEPDYSVGYDWHKGHANFLYADGHVEALSAEEAQQRKSNHLLLTDPSINP